MTLQQFNELLTKILLYGLKKKNGDRSTYDWLQGLPAAEAVAEVQKLHDSIEQAKWERWEKEFEAKLEKLKARVKP